MDRLLRRFLSNFIRHGSITFTTASGAKFACGDGTGTAVAVRILTTATEIRILLNPELALGEAFMDGSFVVEQGTIADALAIPCAIHLPVGHIDDQWTVPLGAVAELDADELTLHVEW